KHNDLQELYKITNLVVLPETFYEPLSRLLLEASSYGIPIIATNIGGNSEIVKNNKIGTLIKKSQFDKLDVYINNYLNNKTEFSKEYSINHIKENFTKRKISNQLNKNYKKLLTMS
ncbi:glycosyltransferase, partial [Candidatus Woesearchaeota archaeon]|nr:glycosyltransferase [Candidatus Woesearchaeota archaeon]